MAGLLGVVECYVCVCDMVVIVFSTDMWVVALRGVIIVWTLKDTHTHTHTHHHTQKRKHTLSLTHTLP